jgi:hypothetical protein
LTAAQPISCVCKWHAQTVLRAMKHISSEAPLVLKKGGHKRDLQHS